MDKCKDCGGDVVLVEYSYTHPFYYDGISEIHCLSCRKRYGRWSLCTIEDGFAEVPFGKKKPQRILNYKV